MRFDQRQRSRLDQPADGGKIGRGFEPEPHGFGITRHPRHALRLVGQRPRPLETDPRHGGEIDPARHRRRRECARVRRAQVDDPFERLGPEFRGHPRRGKLALQRSPRALQHVAADRDFLRGDEREQAGRHELLAPHRGRVEQMRRPLVVIDPGSGDGIAALGQHPVPPGAQRRQAGLVGVVIGHGSRAAAELPRPAHDPSLAPLSLPGGARPEPTHDPVRAGAPLRSDDVLGHLLLAGLQATEDDVVPCRNAGARQPVKDGHPSRIRQVERVGGLPQRGARIGFGLQHQAAADQPQRRGHVRHPDKGADVHVGAEGELRE